MMKDEQKNKSSALHFVHLDGSFGMGVLAVVTAIMLNGCSLNPLMDAGYGNYGGQTRVQTQKQPSVAKFDVTSTDKYAPDTRWFPAYVRWAPDDSHLLVSLCHVNRTGYCRIGKYWIAEKRWELLNLKPQTTYRWPTYAPDGKHIAAVSAPCNRGYHPSQKTSIVLITPDGKQETPLIDTWAIKPNFSDDSKKLIYWRGTGGGGWDVAMFDLTTRQEKMLTHIVAWSGHGAAFFLPGGEKFLFAAWLPTSALPDGTDLLKGTKLWLANRGDVRHPYYGNIRYVADRRDGIVTMKRESAESMNRIQKMELLWPDKLTANNDGVLDVSTKGDVLIDRGVRTIKDTDQKNKAAPEEEALAGVPLFWTDKLIAVRSAQEDAQDRLVFLDRIREPSYFLDPPRTERKRSFNVQNAALSNDYKMIAFTEAPENFWSRGSRLGILEHGKEMPVFITWPGLELDKPAMQSIAE